ncbi:MAG: amidohydrolase family protein [Treponema sp.]|jgi:N-acyl-D-amino-acid deacylase|nr:amidohydrolase family protein [Treponema sp.]
MTDRLIIRNAFMVDGSGSPGYKGDLLAQDGIIRELGIVSGSLGSVIDAKGKILCPGFIDMHRHCDVAALKEGFGKLELLQGITTCVAGNCGMSPVPNAPRYRAQLQNYLAPCLGTFENETFSTHREYAERLRSILLPLDMFFFAGMGAIRIAVKGFSSAPFTSGELKAARSLLQDALDEGAFGLSIGLMYVPELYSSTEEIAALASVMKGGRGILCTHMRWETEKLLLAVREVIDIAKKAEVPLEISHFKAAGVKAWGRVLHETIDLIEAERAKGMDITVDFYPYDCGSSTMMQMLPPGYLSMGIEEAIAGLDKSENIQKMRKLLTEGEPGWDNLSKTIGWDRTVVSSVSLPENQQWWGLTVMECVKESGAADEAEFVARLMHSEKGKVAIINRSMSQEDIDTIAGLPYSSLISDALYGDMKGPHPRLTGAFPRFLRDFVRDRKVLSLETAIRKMTSQNAARLGLTDRGLLAPGRRADMLIFDTGEFRDTSTFLTPTGHAEGLSYAFINGRKVVENGRLTRGDGGAVLASPRA